MLPLLDYYTVTGRRHGLRQLLGTGARTFYATGMPSDEYVREVLDIPLQLQVLSVIAIGHKGMERKPFSEEHLQWEKVHINKFGGK